MSRTLGFISKAKLRDPILVLVGITIALLLRLGFFDLESGDYVSFVGPWYAFIKERGFEAFRFRFADYTPLYLYALYIISVLFPGLSSLFAIKIVSVVSDFVCAVVVAKLVNLKYSRREVSLLAFLAVLFAPTVILNSAWWGQSDILYTTALVVTLYLILTKREIPAFLAFGVAAALKLQALFLAPFLLVMLLKRIVSWTSFLLIPAVYVITILPAWLMGRSFQELMTIYFAQFETYHLLVPRAANPLSLNAPNMYQWLPSEPYELFVFGGLALAATVLCLFVFVVYKSHATVTSSLTIQLATASVLLVPFFLPRMHDRYFFPADVLSIVFAFFFPKYSFVSIVIVLASLFSYHPSLLGSPESPLSLVALGLLITIALICRLLLLTLYPASTKTLQSHATIE